MRSHVVSLSVRLSVRHTLALCKNESSYDHGVFNGGRPHFAGVPLGAGVKPQWGLSTTAIFGDLGGYPSSKTSEIRQAIICDDMLPFVDRQMIAKWMTLNDLKRLFHDKMRFRPALLESERLMSEIVQPLRFCGVLCIARSVSQPIGRHAQLTRCFSAVAELLVYFGQHWTDNDSACCVATCNTWRCGGRS